MAGKFQFRKQNECATFISGGDAWRKRRAFMRMSSSLGIGIPVSTQSKLGLR